eukprot:11215064-Lingulodinium_polyedra.AAC.1
MTAPQCQALQAQDRPHELDRPTGAGAEPAQVERDRRRACLKEPRAKHAEGLPRALQVSLVACGPLQREASAGRTELHQRTQGLQGARPGAARELSVPACDPGPLSSVSGKNLQNFRPRAVRLSLRRALGLPERADSPCL